MPARHLHIIFRISTGLILLLTACNKQEEGVDLSDLHFRIDSPYGTHFITDYEIPFRAIDNRGNDITSAVHFSVDGQAIEGTSYTFDREGTYTVTALWDLGGGLTKPADDTLHVSIIAPRNTSRVLIEDFTGTWCVNCPRVIYHLEQALQQTDRVVPVSIHNRGYNEDPFHFAGVDTLAAAYGIEAYPTPLLERRQVWDEEMASIDEYLNLPRPLGIQLANRLEGNQLQLTVEVRFDMDMPEDTLKLVVYALENGLIADQANATSYYGGENPIPDFEHNHVLRYAFTPVLGLRLPPGVQHFDSIYRWTYNGPVPSEIASPERADFVAFVLRGDTRGITINSNKTHINETSTY